MSTMIKSPVRVVPGKYYNVPHVCNKSTLGELTPILLPAHIDGKENCLNETPLHYHVDFRFIELDQSKTNACFAELCSKPFLKKALAIRSFTESISHIKNSAFFFINRWYKNHLNRKLADDNRCLHQGLQLVNPCGICPGHGLTWDLKTKKLAKFEIPFYLELSNDEIPNPKNPRGIMKDGFCQVTVNTVHPFVSNGTVIMVDSKGKRVGKQFQKIEPMTLRNGYAIMFTGENLCTRE